MFEKVSLCAWCCATLNDGPQDGLYIDKRSTKSGFTWDREKIYTQEALIAAVEEAEVIKTLSGHTVGGYAVTKVAGTDVCAVHAGLLIRREESKRTK